MPVYICLHNLGSNFCCLWALWVRVNIILHDSHLFVYPRTNVFDNYIRYFTRTILQFQFAEALCDISGHDGPLHRCDFSGSKKAGEALAKMLKLGKSRSWQDALEILTGTYALLSINQSKTFCN